MIKAVCRQACDTEAEALVERFISTNQITSQEADSVMLTWKINALTAVK